MGHAGHHHHGGLNAAFWLTAGFAVVELAGGLISNSLALLADAGHMASDVVALGLAMVAGRIAARPAHAGMSYGYGRAKVLAAQVNGVMLWFLSGWIVWEAFSRLMAPPPVQGGLVIWVAVIGLVINMIVMRWLHGSHDINTRAAYWHVLGDALGSVAAIIAGVTILFTGWMLIDPLLSFVVAAILAWGGWRLVRETTMALMEGAPVDMDVAMLRETMQKVEGVVEVHHIHIWHLPAGDPAISAHIQLESMAQWPTLLPTLLALLKTHGIAHATLQPEVCCCDDAVCHQD